MYSNDFTQIKNGLTNYLGATIKALPYDNVSACKHELVAMLTEEAIKLSKEDNDTYNMYILKPLLRGTLNILKARINVLESLSINEEMKQLIINNKKAIEVLENIIKQSNL